MATLQIFPPNATNEALMAGVPGVRHTPIPVTAFDGPDHRLGPEATGAILLLHMTMVDEEKTQQFWRQVALTCTAAAESPGLIRLIAFFDGKANWALAFWRTLDAARAFARSRPHLDAIEDMRRHTFEYTHYAGLWEPAGARPREVYCDECGTEALMPVENCPSCGNQLIDVFREP